MTATQAGAAMATHRVDFIDEDNAGCMLLRLLEHIANSRSAHADEHFYEIRTGDGEERNLGFSGNSTGKKRFTRSWRTDHQHAARNFAAEPLKLTGVFKEFDNFDDFFFGFFDAGHIGESDLYLIL